MGNTAVYGQERCTESSKPHVGWVGQPPVNDQFEHFTTCTWSLHLTPYLPGGEKLTQTKGHSVIAFGN